MNHFTSNGGAPITEKIGKYLKTKKEKVSEGSQTSDEFALDKTKEFVVIAKAAEKLGQKMDAKGKSDDEIIKALRKLVDKMSSKQDKDVREMTKAYFEYAFEEMRNT